MFEHIKFSVSDSAVSRAFLIRAIEPLRVVMVAEGAPVDGVELSSPSGTVSL